MRFAVHQFFLGILALHMFGFGAGNSIPFELAPENNTMDADLENMPIRPYLWSVQHPNTTAISYLFGTIHLRHDLVMHFVPYWVQELFINADVAVFESNANNLSALLKDLFYCISVPLEKSAKFLLPATTLDRVNKVVENLPERSKGIFTLFGPSSMSPDFLLLMLQQTVISLDQSEFDFDDENIHSQNVLNSTTPRPLSLDSFLMRNASFRAQEQRFVETLREICEEGLYASMEPKHLSVVINSVLDQMENQLKKENDSVGPAMALLALYGYDLPELEEFFNPKSNNNNSKADMLMENLMENATQLLLNDLFVTRNRRWLKHMNAWMQEEPETTFFFAFGVGHFIGGEGNLVQLLEEIGYVIRRLGGKEDATYKEELSNFLNEYRWIIVDLFIAIMMILIMIALLMIWIYRKNRQEMQVNLPMSIIDSPKNLMMKEKNEIDEQQQ